MSSDAIGMLREDHKEIKKVFREFKNAGENADATKGRLAKRILELLTVHTYLENEVVYPRVRELVPDLESDILESYEEHHVADVLCMELMSMDPSDERFTAKVTVLIESVEHHIEEEETGWFPKLREAVGRNELREMGARMAELRPAAPRMPSQPGALKKAVDAILA